MRASKFVFDYVQLLYYQCHKINMNCVGSCMNCPDWIKIKTTTINLINNKDNKYFQYTVAVALNFKEIK